MAKNELSDSAVKLIRILSISIGILILIATASADLIGLSSGRGVSRNQIGFLGSGLALIAFGLMGRKFPGFYRGAAVLVLNVILVFVMIEFASIVLVKLIDSEKFRTREQKIEQGILELVENNIVLGKYAPFVVWRSNPALNCDSVTVDPGGYRVTPAVSTDQDAFKVFLFGGSAMWGTNVSDHGTIGAFLQTYLSESTGSEVAVSNLAQVGHSSTQEIIELMLQLRSGNVPDFVVYYDGFNDVWGGYEAGRAGSHHSEGPIAARVEGKPEAFNIRPPLETLLKESNIWLLITSIRSETPDFASELQRVETYSTMGVHADSLAVEIVETYLGNCRIVEALGEQYGFEFIFVWQPSIWYGEKMKTEEEQDIYNGGFEFFLAGGDPAFKELYTTTYSLFEDAAVDSFHYFSFSGIFNDVEETVYNDYSGVHVYSWANELIAMEIVEIFMALN